MISRAVLKAAGRSAVLAILLAAGVRFVGAQTATADVEFTAAERTTILSHGPWPPRFESDPSNRVSGNPAAIALGRQLFMQPVLAPDRLFSCASCHRPVLMFTDGLERALGRRRSDRNTPTVVGLAGNRWFGWDGGNDNLWAQSARPILASYEIGATVDSVKQVFVDDTQLGCRFSAVFGQSAAEMSAKAVTIAVGKALAAYQEQLHIGPSSFDAFRIALAANDTAAMAKYPSAARRGLKLFVGHGRCSLCHQGPRFSHGEFDSVGVNHFIEPGKVDSGRFGGIQSLLKTPANLLGKFNDDPVRAPGTATKHVAFHPRTYGQFKVPSLRNVAQSAPYMHAGSHATLQAVVEHYNSISPDRLHTGATPLLRPLHLEADEVSAMVAFLRSLSGEVLDLGPVEVSQFDECG